MRVTRRATNHQRFAREDQAKRQLRGALLGLEENSKTSSILLAAEGLGCDRIQLWSNLHSGALFKITELAGGGGYQLGVIPAVLGLPEP